LADERWLVVGGSVAEKQPSGDALIDEPSRHLWWALPSLPVQLKGVVAVRSALESFLHYGLAKSIERSFRHDVHPRGLSRERLKCERGVTRGVLSRRGSATR